jgi:hypothetical protein
MRAMMIALTAAIALPAGAAVPRPMSANIVRTISYETGPCFGRCPVYRVTVGADGIGSFQGERFTSVSGTRSFRATAAHYRAFAALLEPVRPAHGEVRRAPPHCKTAATDMPSVHVEWTMADRTHRSLYFYYGCDMIENRALAERLSRAPSFLPIAGMIGTRP